MNKRPSVSIGITAYNEEQNIQKLIRSLLDQKRVGFSFSHILIISDGSTDKTVARVREIKNKKVRVEEGKRRLGKSARVNELLSKLQTDVILLFDADVAVTDKNFISKLIRKSNIEKSGVVTVRVIPLPGRNFFERCINHSVLLQNDIRASWKNGDNYLAFRGSFFAFSRKAAEEIRLNRSLISNDAYIYFAAKRLGFTTKYIPSLHVYYRSPSTFEDHFKQSSRFQHSLSELSFYFPDQLKDEYKIHPGAFATAILRSFVKNPVYFMCFVAIYLRSKVKKPLRHSSLWNMAVSTKVT